MEGIIKIEEIKDISQVPMEMRVHILRKELNATKKELEIAMIENAKLKVEMRVIMQEVSDATRFMKMACESEKQVERKKPSHTGHKNKLDYKHDLCKCGNVKLKDSPMCRKCYMKDIAANGRKPQKKKRK